MALSSDDLQAIKGIVQTTVQPMIDEAVDALAQSTATGFAEVYAKLARHDEQFAAIREDISRIEHKLAVTIDRVDEHSVALRQLIAKPA